MPRHLKLNVFIPTKKCLFKKESEGPFRLRGSCGVSINSALKRPSRKGQYINLVVNGKECLLHGEKQKLAYKNVKQGS